MRVVVLRLINEVIDGIALVINIQILEHVILVVQAHQSHVESVYWGDILVDQ